MLISKPAFSGKTEISLRDKQIKELEKTVGKLQENVGDLTKSLKDLEQYGRRKTIHLNNVKLEDESECESTVLANLNNALPMGQNVYSEDIERCHPIGKPNKKNNRQVMVKFKAYKVMSKVYESRFELSNVFMTGDFIASNQKIINKLVELKKGKKIKKKVLVL